MKTCAKCKIEKEDTDFSPSKFKLNSGWCKTCCADYDKNWAKENTEKSTLNKKKWAQNNPERNALNKKLWTENNSEKVKTQKRVWYENNTEITKIRSVEWHQENHDKALNSTKKYVNKRYHDDPVFRNRIIISRKVLKMLKSQGSSKNGESSFDYFPWTLEELWNHLLEYMKQPGNEWMHKDNQGKYDSKTWDDNDRETWTWQLDHIIPQNILPYDSMEHPNFKKCWDLSNLRPLSAKQNVLDGVKRIRHH